MEPQRGDNQPLAAHLRAGATAALVAWALLLAASAEARAAGSYYVCNQPGQTGPGGLGCSFSSVDQVNNAAVAAGAAVYFASGDRFSDATLYPRSGVTYASYAPPQGAGPEGGIRAILAPASGSNAVTFFGASDVTLDGLQLDGGDAGRNLGDGVFSSENSANSSVHDEIEHCAIDNWARGIQTGYADSDWTIAENTIDSIALDGVYFARSRDRGGVGPVHDIVTGNWITNTGVFPHAGGNANPVHGIYDNSIDSQVTGNTISNFQSDGVSLRFRGSLVSDNVISGGEIGIAWFQEDSVAATSTWKGNLVVGVSQAGLFVCGAADGCDQPRERLLIEDNRIAVDAGVGCMELRPSAGAYVVAGNLCLPAEREIAPLVASSYVAAGPTSMGYPW
jgi:hypothetical protein